MERRRGRPSSRLDVDLQASRYTSPLPSPDDLKRYSELLPDAPERLLSAGELEQAHRHQIERDLVELDREGMPSFYAGQRRGQVIGGMVAIAYLAVMAFAISEGYGIVGVTGAAAGVAAIIYAIRRDPSAPSEPAEAPGEAPQEPQESGAADRDQTTS